MKKLVVHPSSGVRGSIKVPGDKSISHRSVMLGSLAYGTTTVENFLTSADCVSTMNIFKAMGVRIKQIGTRLMIDGKGINSLQPPHKTLDAGNSGTTSRIILGLLAGQPFTCRLTGDQYLRRRPMKRVVVPLTKMGAQISGPDGASLLPLKIEGQKLKGITYRLPVASAQVKSSLLLAGLFAEGITTVIEPTPTRDHTERMFSTFGIPYREKAFSVLIKGPVKPFKARRIKVPGDISSAAFFIVAALITPNSKLLLENVGVNPTRTGLLDALRAMGGNITVYPIKTRYGAEPVANILVESSQLKGIKLDNEEIVPRMIDEFPVFAVAATQAKGTTVVKKASDLKVKESDRILMMAVTLKKMGADITPTEDGWIIKGPTPLKGCKVSSGGDHRIAMSIAVAALIAQGSSTISDTENINTSFPNFEKLLKQVAKK
jgi:3-phosphoshikimate 1-carboxyvinyltransferase